MEIVFLASILGFVLGYCYPFLFHILSGSVREIYTYSLDAVLFLWEVERALASRFFRLQFSGYGHLYFNLCIVAAQAYSIFASLDEQALFFIAQVVSLAGGCATIVLVFYFARQFLGTPGAVFSASALALTPAVLGLSTDMRPDTWQMFFVTLSLYFCCRAVRAEPAQAAPESRERLVLGSLWAAAAAAGAAFSSKYAGVLLLPVLVALVLAAPAPALNPASHARLLRVLALCAAALVLPLLAIAYFATPAPLAEAFPSWGQLLPPETLARLAKAVRWSSFVAGLLCLTLALAYARGAAFESRKVAVVKITVLLAVALIFASAFALTSPWAVYRLPFVPNLLWISSHVNFGHGTKAPWYGVQWLELLAGAEVLGAAVCALALTGCAALAYGWRKRRFHVGAVPFLVLLVWSVVYIAYLIVRVNLVKPYYLLPVVPAVALLGAAGISAISEALKARVGGRAAALAAAALACAGVVAHAVQSYPALSNLRSKELPRALAPENQAIGGWLLRCIPAETKIMAAAYSYVPVHFPSAHLHLDQGSHGALVNFAPAVVILNTEDIAFFTGPLDSSTTNIGNIEDKLRYYEAVAGSGAWRRGPVFGRFQIFIQPRLARELVSRGAECALD